MERAPQKLIEVPADKERIKALIRAIIKSSWRMEDYGDDEMGSAFDEEKALDLIRRLINGNLDIRGLKMEELVKLDNSGLWGNPGSANNPISQAIDSRRTNS